MKKTTKKTVHKISNDFSYDFILIGIIAHQLNFKLCRELNKTLELSLSRKEDHVIFSQKRMEEQRFAMFECLSPTEEHYIFLSNKQNNMLLIPEQPQYDFFLLIFPNALPLDEDELVNQVKNTKYVLGAYSIDPSRLKSRDNLVF